MAGTIVGEKTRVRGLTRIVGDFTTDASGDCTRAKIGSGFGRIVAVQYDPATGGVATGADITISDDTGAALVTLTNAGTAAIRLRPSAVVTTNLGVAITDATAASASTEVDRDIFVGGDIYLTVAQGGATKTGKVVVLIDESAAA